MSTPLIIVGGGEHARVVGVAANSDPSGFDVLGFVDPEPCDRTAELLGVPRLGDDDALAKYPAARLVLGIGAVGVDTHRTETVARLRQPIERWATVVHGSAWVASTADCAAGVVIMAGAIVQVGARLGAHALVNSGAIVEHDVVLGDFAQVSPGATIGGGAEIGDSTFVGLGAAVRDHVKIGSRVLIAMGSVVVDNVEDGAEVLGVPARSKP